MSIRTILNQFFKVICVRFYSRAIAENRVVEDLGKLCKEGPLDHALETVELFWEQGTRLNRNNAYHLLRRFEERKDLDSTRRLQLLMISSGLSSLAVLGDHLIRLFVYHGCLLNSNEAFNNIIKPSACSWAGIILGNAKLGHGHIAFELYSLMQMCGEETDGYIYAGLLKACTAVESLTQSRLIHNEIQRNDLLSDLVLGSLLLDVYMKCGSLVEAVNAFLKLPVRDVVTWNTMIAGYGDHEEAQLALNCYQEMQLEGMIPDVVTFLGALEACAIMRALNQGRLLHEQIISNGLELNLILGSNLVDMYVKCGSLEEGCSAFHKLPTQDVVSWSAMVAGYAQHGLISLALEYFDEMQQEGIKPNVVSWSAIIAGYAEHGDGNMALEWFERMQEEGVDPDEVTFMSALKACASTGALAHGRVIHKQMLNSGYNLDLVVKTILIDMYAKCGSLSEAYKLFLELPMRNILSWNAMIGGYAQHGEGILALECFEKMQEGGLKPDEASFIGIFVACSRSGLVDEGYWYFKSMEECHGIFAGIPHCLSIIDLLGRAGFLSKAEDFLRATMRQDMVGWSTLLGACKMHGNVEVGKRCFDQIISLDDPKK